MEATKDFCSNLFYGIYLIFKYVFLSIHYVISSILRVLGYCWYPCKERTKDCCDCCNKRMNPAMDPTYNTF